MNYPENLATAAEYLKKSIPHMVNNKVPANPINYALWYNYVANHNPALNRALDGIIASKEMMTPEQCEELFYYYIISEHIEDHEETLKGITKLASKLLSNLNQSVDGSEAFNNELSGNIEQLKQAKSLNQISEIADSVISASENIQHANQQFICELQRANEEIGSLKAQLQQAENQAYVDQLTKLYNRHAFDKQLYQLTTKEGVAENVCLVLADLDHFKSFNDDYGHVIGDRVLQRMGEIIQDYCPDNAIGARYGGEEFAVIISNASIEESVEVAETLRQKLQQIRVKVKNSDKVLNNISASFGVARFNPTETLETFIDRADQALYRAKDNGRNRVEVYGIPA